MKRTLRSLVGLLFLIAVGAIAASGPPFFFHETWTASDFSLWPSYWSMSDTNSPNYTLDIVAGEGRYSRFGTRLAWINDREAVDLEQRVMYRYTGGNNATYQLFARRLDSDQTSFYWVEHRNSTTLLIGRQVSGGRATLQSRGDVAGFTGATNWWMRFNVSTTGAVTYLECVIWPTNSVESAGYRVSATDSSPALQDASGRYGMVFSVNNRTILVDNYTAKWPAPRGTVVLVR